MNRIAIEINDEVKQKIRLYCAENGLTIKEFLTDLIIKFFNK